MVAEIGSTKAAMFSVSGQWKKTATDVVLVDKGKGLEDSDLFLSEWRVPESQENDWR